MAICRVAFSILFFGLLGPLPLVQCKVAIGIDLGTSFSVATFYRQGKVEVIPGPQGERLVPSEVYFSPDQEILSGTAAVSSRVRDPASHVYQIKRVLGHSYDDPTIAAAKESFTFDIVPCAQDQQFREILASFGSLFGADVKKAAPGAKAFASGSCVSVPNMAHQLPAEFVSAAVLFGIREAAETFLGEPVRDAVITVPAYFGERQKEATIEAANIAGLNVLRLLPEPTSAAIAFGQVTNDFQATQELLVVDFGGGTFDVSIVTHRAGELVVSGIDGDSHLGGSDLDEILAEHICQTFDPTICSSLNPRQRSLLRSKATEAKIDLSFRMSTTVFIDSFHNGRDLKAKVTRAAFENLIRPVLTKLEGIVKRLLRDTGAKPSLALLVGGSSRIPAVGDLIAKKFHLEISKQVHPDEAVGIGAGYLAATLTGQFDGLEGELVGKLDFVSSALSFFGMQKGQETSEARGAALLLREVTAHTLGTTTWGDRMTPIIPRFSQYPGKWTNMFTTVQDFQKSVVVEVREGESKTASANNLLNSFEISGIERARQGIPKLELTFEIDANGVLHASATDIRAGATAAVEVNTLEWSAMDQESIGAYQEVLKQGHREE